MNYRTIALALLVALSLNVAAQDDQPDTDESQDRGKKAYPWMGKIERLDPAINNLLAPDAMIEKLAGGFDWSEGPVWDKRNKSLLFSDVPRNVVFRWKEGERTGIALEASGYSGDDPRGGEPGSNGLTFDHKGRLVLCQHGDRRVARLEKGKFVSVAQHYRGRRFNSPNDLVYHSNGDLYFTDPSYGLIKGNNDPAKELIYNGVYRVKPDGKVTLLTSELTFPNGIALSPDEKTLYVAVSDPNRAIYMAYPLKSDGTLERGHVLFDATPLVKAGLKGLPDGLKVDTLGNLWATGPGGVLILTPDGKHLGTINTGVPTGNCAWGDNGSTLYITADMYLCRVKTRVKGFGF